MEENRFEIPKSDYFTLNHNIYCGSWKGFNYKIDARGDQFLLSVWLGMLNLENSQVTSRGEFPLDDAGYDAALAWLEEQYQSLKQE